MAWVGIALMAASTMMQMRNTSAAGKAAQAAGLQRQVSAQHQAAQARQKGNEELAASQRVAHDEHRLGKLMRSRALAHASASGGGAGDPTVTTIIGRLGAEEELRAHNALFTGQAAKRHLNLQADLLEYEGIQHANAGAFQNELAKSQALMQGLSGAASMAGSASKAGYFGKTGGNDNMPVSSLGSATDFGNRNTSFRSYG